MRKIKFSLVLLLYFFLVDTTTGYVHQNPVFVSGRAVDEQGAAIADAVVTLYYPPCRGCIDHILPVSFSLPDGVFFIDSTGIPTNELRLFIAERVPEGFWSPFGAPPFRKLSYSQQFQGITVRPSKGKVRVDLGDVPVRIQYRKVIVELPKIFGKQYLPDQGLARRMKLTVRNHQRKIIYNGYVPEVAFDPTFSSLKLALPKGAWTLEFFLENQNKKIHSPPLSIDMSRLSASKDSVLTIPQR